MDVVGIGSLAMDVIMRVDVLPKADEFCIIEETAYLPGGSGTNVIVQLARLGVSCAYMGQVGDDRIGSDILESLRNEGVDISGMKIKKGGVTLHTDVVVDRKGDKFIMLDMGNSFSALSRNDVDISLIKESKILYTDLFPPDAAMMSLKTAHENSLKTIFNMQAQLQSYENLGVSKKEILNSLQYASIFAPCRAGLFQLAGTEDLEQCLLFIRNYFNGIFIVTLGSSGSVTWDEKNKRIDFPARTITPIDTTGAGDSFIGSFIYRYYFAGSSLEDAIQFANACAAYTCTGVGARFSPTLQQAEEFFVNS